MEELATLVKCKLMYWMFMQTVYHRQHRISVFISGYDETSPILAVLRGQLQLALLNFISADFSPCTTLLGSLVPSL